MIMKNFNMPDLKETPPGGTIVVPMTENQEALIKAKPYQLDSLSAWQLRGGIGNVTPQSTPGSLSVA